MTKTSTLALLAFTALALSTSLTQADGMIGGIGSISVPSGGSGAGGNSGNPMAGGTGNIQVPAGTQSGSGSMTPGIDLISVPTHGGATAASGMTGKRGQAGGAQVNVAIACVVGGTPEAFPNDLWLTNRGDQPLKAGAKIKFAVPSTGARGALLLNADIPAGKQVKIADVLNGGADAGAPCDAKLI